jgi:hypothetical protein
MKTESGGCSPDRGESRADPPLAADWARRPAHSHGKRARAATWIRVASGLILAAIAAISWWLALSSSCAAGERAVCRTTRSAPRDVRVAESRSAPNAFHRVRVAELTRPNNGLGRAEGRVARTAKRD